MNHALLPVGARVRIVGSPEWTGNRDLIGANGTVVAHQFSAWNETTYLVVVIDGHPLPGPGADGWWLTADEVEVVS